MPRKSPQPEKHQPTTEELDERILMCRRLLGQGLYNGQVKRAVAAHYNLSPRTVERYLRRARSMICAETGRKPEEHRADAYAIYRELQQSKSEYMRLKATQELVDLVGAAVPSISKHDHTSAGKELKGLTENAPDPRAASIARITHLLEERAGMPDDPSGLVSDAHPNGTAHSNGDGEVDNHPPIPPS